MRRATPNGNGKKNRQKSLPAPSPDALFRLRAHFLSILGSRTDLKIGKKNVPERHEAYFLTTLFRFLGVLFARVCSGSVPGRFWRLRGPPRTRFCNDFARFFCRFRRDLVVVCRVPPECCRDTPPASGTHSAGFLWGTAISRSELNTWINK